MAGRAKFFELLDFPKFATPTVLGMDPIQTSFNLLDRLGGGGFMSYASIWSRMDLIVAGMASESFILEQFSPYEDDWKNDTLQDVVRLLRQHFNGRGRWYALSQKPTKVAGFWFKPSIKGFWYVDGQSYAVVINARKLQRLAPEHVRFLARGVHELHCVDDPNDPIPLVVDLSEHNRGEGRLLRPYIVPVERAISLDEFEASVRHFLKALELAGVSVLPDSTDSVVGLFKRK
jgi:hypothetical protein